MKELNEEVSRKLELIREALTETETTGYLAREIVANPTTTDTLVEGIPVAWNPSLPGQRLKILL